MFAILPDRSACCKPHGHPIFTGALHCFKASLATIQDFHRLTFLLRYGIFLGLPLSVKPASKFLIFTLLVVGVPDALTLTVNRLMVSGLGRS